jgi:hypothetical protein
MAGPNLYCYGNRERKYHQGSHSTSDNRGILCRLRPMDGSRRRGNGLPQPHQCRGRSGKIRHTRLLRIHGQFGGTAWICDFAAALETARAIRRNVRRRVGPMSGSGSRIDLFTRKGAQSKTCFLCRWIPCRPCLPFARLIFGRWPSQFPSLHIACRCECVRTSRKAARGIPA